MSGLSSVRLAGDMPEIAGSYRGTLLLAGGGRCVWEDLTRVGPSDADVMCVNDVGLRFPGHIEHWYTNHSDQIEHLTELRNLGSSGRTWGPKYTHSVAAAPSREKADVVWPIQMRGNSGLTAILVALALGYGKIIVCGIPLDDSGHFHDPPEGHWLQSKARGLSHPVKWSNFAGDGYARARASDEQAVYDGRVVWASTL
jgi:hypothetical protein